MRASGSDSSEPLLLVPVALEKGVV